jgi:hypothetical protein
LDPSPSFSSGHALAVRRCAGKEGFDASELTQLGFVHGADR